MIVGELTADTYHTLHFPDSPPGRPHVYINMIASLDGKAVVEDTERGLGSDNDRLLMRRLRFHADMVLAGAGTARASGSGSRINDPALEAGRAARGLSRNPLAAVITTTGNLDTSAAFFTTPEFDAVVFLGEYAPPEAEHRLRATGRRVYRVGAGRQALHDLLAIAARELGVRRLLVEGGPTLNAQLLREGLVDELFVTVSGRIVGGHDTPTIVEGERFAPGELPGFVPVSLYYSLPDGELYTRWRHIP